MFRYRAHLQEGDNCLMIEIEDGGPNDADGTANGKINLMLAIERGLYAGASIESPASSNGVGVGVDAEGGWRE